MADTDTVSISIRIDLMADLEHYAQASHQTVTAVAEEALRHFVSVNPEANKMRDLHLRRAAHLGLGMEDYLARMIKEWRREDREQELNETRRS